MSDDAPDSAPADSAATLCNALVIMTGVFLIAGIVIVNMINDTHYGKGWF
jgi:hypothetical protein